ncbi:hypothetical protein CRENBAI_007679 [Crenichthys baileyi]|uniref:Uncharacterized protein n=1 Tax=Crenichthys baileyi TaxID=28760 RepID=A0AAV9SCF8_9TELE
MLPSLDKGPEASSPSAHAQSLLMSATTPHPPTRPGLAPLPAITAFLSRAAAEPQQLKASVLTFSLITRLGSLMDQGFSLVPTLERSLSLFGCQVGLAHWTTASAPFSSDQIIARLTGWLPSVCHPGYSSDQQHCFPHLRHFKKAQELNLPPEDAEDFCNSPDGLFGAYCQSVLEQLQTFHDELERVRRNGALFWPGTYSSHTTSPGWTVGFSNTSMLLVQPSTGDTADVGGMCVKC